MSSLTYTEAEASEGEAKHLVLRQLAKDVTVRLSQPLKVADEKLDTNLLAVSDASGFAFAATNQGFQVIRLSRLRTFFRAAKRNTSLDFDQATAAIDTVSQPDIGSFVTFLRVANQHSVLLAGFQSGVIAGWSISGLIEASNTTPSFILQPPSPGLSLIDLVSNPSDRPELAVALYRQSAASGLDSGTPILVNLNSASFAAQLDATRSRATSVCWSVKGKQIAVGLENGEIVQMTPEGEAKDRIARPASLDASYYVCDLKWLENHVFVATYNKLSSNPDEPEHAYEVFTILRDLKASTVTFAKMPMDPAPPYGDISRKGTRYSAWLKSWEPSKHLFFVSSGPSTDVGLIACSSQEPGPGAWATMELEETSKPILPFSSLDESSDTAPVALEFDLTATEEVEDPNAVARGDGKTTLPSVPILLVYTSDGVLLAYNVINTEGGPFEGMVTPSRLSGSASTASQASIEPSSVARAAPATPATPAKSSDTGSAPVFGSNSGFGKPSAFGSASSPAPAFGSASAFGQPSAFGSTSAFGKPSAFGSASTPAPAFGVPAQSGNGFGFGAFSSAGGANKTPSAFGSTGFGFGASSPGSQTSEPSTNASGATTPSASAKAPTSVFGANAASSTPSAFGTTSAFGQTPKLALGQSSFGQASTSAFGTPSAFGSASPFGSTSASPFASKPSDSTASKPATPFSAFNSGGNGSGAGGFGGFASNSAGSFGSAAPKSTESVFGSGGGLQASTYDPAKPLFGASTPSSGTESAFKTSNSSFGTGSFSSFAASKTESKDTKAEQTSKPEDKESCSFSLGALDGLLDDSQPSASNKTAGDATPPDSGVNTVVPTPRKDDTSKPSFTPAKATPHAAASAEPSVKAEQNKQDNAGTKSPTMAPTSSFSSFQPGFNAGASFGGQPFAFGKPSGPSPTPSPPASTDSTTFTAKDQIPPITGSLEETKESVEGAKGSQLDAISDGQEAETSKSSSLEKPSFAIKSSTEASSEPVKQISEPAKADHAAQEQVPADKPATTPPASSQAAAPSQVSTPAKETTPANSFFGFNSRAPRSSSPLTAAPVNSFDLSPAPSPEKPAASSQKPFSFQSASQGSDKGFSFGTPSFGAGSPSPSPFGQTPFSGLGQNAAQPLKLIMGNKDAPPADSQKAQQSETAKSSNPPIFSFNAAAQARPTQQGQASLPVPSFSEMGQQAQQAKDSPNALSQRGASTQSLTKASASPSPAKQSGSPLTLGKTPQLSSTSTQVSKDLAEKGIQGEFLKTYLVLTNELAVLRDNVGKCAGFLQQLREPTGGARIVEDFADPSKWTFGDLSKMTSLSKSLHSRADELDAQISAQKRQVTELQSLQLKAEAKREEVARFIRARSDPEFAKMIRVRQLGPEHVENQKRLRNASQSVRERIQELEEHLAALKNKLQDAKTGRTSMKAPSLDSVARACRNITARTSDVALELDNLALEIDLLRGPDTTYSRAPSGLLSRSVSVFSDLDNSSALNDVGNLAQSLPTVSYSQAVDEALQAECVKRDAMAVFMSARKEPIYNTRAVPAKASSRKATKAMDGSDLQIAFAKGPVHLTKRPPASQTLPESSLKPASLPTDLPKQAQDATRNLPAAACVAQPSSSKVEVFKSPSVPASAPTTASAPAPSFSFAPIKSERAVTGTASDPASSSKGFGAGFGSSNFAPLDFTSSKVSAGMFDLPVQEDTPFQPGGRGASAGASSSRLHNTAKAKRSSFAVQLPSVNQGDSVPATSAAASGQKAPADFFAFPSAAKPKESPTPASFKGFSGFNSTSKPADSVPASSMGATASGARETPSMPVFNFANVDKPPTSSATQAQSADKSKASTSSFEWSNKATESSLPAVQLTAPSNSSIFDSSFGTTKSPMLAPIVKKSSASDSASKQAPEKAAPADFSYPPKPAEPKSSSAGPPSMFSFASANAANAPAPSAFSFNPAKTANSSSSSAPPPASAFAQFKPSGSGFSFAQPKGPETGAKSPSAFSFSPSPTDAKPAPAFGFNSFSKPSAFSFANSSSTPADQVSSGGSSPSLLSRLGGTPASVSAANTGDDTDEDDYEDEDEDDYEDEEEEDYEDEDEEGEDEEGFEDEDEDEGDYEDEEGNFEEEDEGSAAEEDDYDQVEPEEAEVTGSGSVTGEVEADTIDDSTAVEKEEQDEGEAEEAPQAEAGELVGESKAAADAEEEESLSAVEEEAEDDDDADKELHDEEDAGGEDAEAADATQDDDDDTQQLSDGNDDHDAESNEQTLSADEDN